MDDKHNVRKMQALGAIAEWLKCVEMNAISSLDTDWGQSRQLLLQYMQADVQALMNDKPGEMSDSAMALYETLR